MAGQRPGDTLPVSHRSARPAAVSASHAGLAPNLAAAPGRLIAPNYGSAGPSAPRFRYRHTAAV